MKYIIIIGVLISTFFVVRPLSATEVQALVSDTVLRYQLNAPVDVLTSIARVESSNYPLAIGDDGNSFGLFQIQLRTAKDLYERLGYRKYSPNIINLMRAEVSTYFACAYFDWLNTNQNDYDKSLEWKVRAYNGGRGWESSDRAVSNTAIYWGKVVNGLSY